MSLSNLAKTAATLANLVKTSIKTFLLKEDGFYLLLETGDRIRLDGSENQISNLAKTSA
jgi:hypothetical protein